MVPCRCGMWRWVLSLQYMHGVLDANCGGGVREGKQVARVVLSVLECVECGGSIEEERCRGWQRRAGCSEQGYGCGVVFSLVYCGGGGSNFVWEACVQEGGDDRRVLHCSVEARVGGGAGLGDGRVRGGFADTRLRSDDSEGDDALLQLLLAVCAIPRERGVGWGGGHFGRDVVKGWVIIHSVGIVIPRGIEVREVGVYAREHSLGAHVAHLTC